MPENLSIFYPIRSLCFIALRVEGPTASMRFFVDKCIKGMCHVYLNDLFEINSGSTCTCSSRRLNMSQPTCRYHSNYGRNNLKCQCIKLWNDVYNRFEAVSNYHA